MIRSVLGIAGALLLLTAEAAGAQTAPPSARQLELAQRYVKAMNMEAMIGGVMDQLTPTMMGSSLNALPAEKRDAVVGVVRKISQKMMTRMADQMAPILAEVFTQKELEDVVAFYEGQSGRAIIEKTPQLSAKMAPLMKNLMPEMQAEMIAEMCQVLDCANKAPEAKAS